MTHKFPFLLAISSLCLQNCSNVCKDIPFCHVFFVSVENWLWLKTCTLNGTCVGLYLSQSSFFIWISIGFPNTPHSFFEVNASSGKVCLHEVIKINFHPFACWLCFLNLVLHILNLLCFLAHLIVTLLIYGIWKNTRCSKMHFQQIWMNILTTLPTAALHWAAAYRFMCDIIYRSMFSCQCLLKDISAGKGKVKCMR